MITKSVLGIMTASIAVAGTTGYMVGKSSSIPRSDRIAVPANESGMGAVRPQAGFNSDNTEILDSQVRSGSMRLSSGRVLDTSWHEYTGPFTVESWMAIRQAVLSAPLQQVEDTLARLAELPVSRERLELERELLAMWATKDPLAALEFAADIEMRDQRSDSREDILRVWASSEPQAAFEWLESQMGLIPDGEYHRLFDDAMRGYADLDLTQAIDYFNTLSNTLDERQTRRGLNEIVESMIQQGKLAEATDLLGQLDDPDIRQEAAEELMSELAEVDLNQALGLLESYQGSEFYGSMQRELVEEWARNDPAQAAAYISSTVAPGNDFSDMASQVVRNWDDLAAASEWLLQYDPSPELDRPTMTLVFRAGRDDPAGALSWASSVTDERMQNRAISVVASNWKATDEASYTQFLSQNPDLTPEQIKIIQNAPARAYGSRGWGGRQ